MVLTGQNLMKLSSVQVDTQECPAFRMMRGRKLIITLIAFTCLYIYLSMRVSRRPGML